MIEFDSSDAAICEASTGVWLSYRDLDREINAAVEQLNFKDKSLIFLFCRNNLESILYYLAALRQGNAIALLDAGLDQSFKFNLVSQYQPELVIDTNTQANWKDNTFAETYNLVAHPKYQVFRRQELDLAAINKELALLLPTSGTTGSPKFVRLSERNIKANANSIRQALSIDAQQRPITSLPFHYSYGLSVLNSHLAAGAGIVITDENVLSNEFWDALRSNECTSFAGVPYSYLLLDRLGLNRLNVPSLKVLTQAGGRLSNELIQSFNKLMKARSGRFFVMYGQTEATARIAIVPSERLSEKIGSAGLAIPGGKLMISLDGELTTEPHKSGSIVYTGDNVMLGYANSRKDLASGDVMNGTLDTGDIGHLDDEGFLFITGRLKRIAKIFGHRLNLDEIETILSQFGPAAVIGSDDKIIIYCETDTDKSLAEQKQYLARVLHIDQSVFEFRMIERIPRTANGKIDYHPLEKDK